MNSVFLAIAAMMTIVAMQFVLWPTARQAWSARKFANPAILIAIGVMPIVAFGVYNEIGNPQAANTVSDAGKTILSQSSAGQSGLSKGVASIASLVDGLEDRLEKEPEDGHGWLLLAKSYRHLGRPEDFARAYARARSLGQSEPALGDYLTVEKPESESAGQAVIEGRLSISDDLQVELPADATVFIIARAESGSVAPLAVLRTSVRELPYSFEISDANAMIESMPLSSVGSIVITAKISSSGDALDTLPGVEVSSVPVSMDNSDFLDLRIARKRIRDRKQLLGRKDNE